MIRINKKQDNRSFIEKAIDEFNCFGWFDEPERAREDDGTYAGDDHSTEDTNEAWKKGKSPKKERNNKK